VLEDSFSYSPSDAIAELAEAIDAVVSHAVERHVILHLEPVEVELRFMREEDGLVSVRAVEHPNRARDAPGHTLFSVAIPFQSLGKAVWRALRVLSTLLPDEEYERAWRHEFPHRIVDQLGARFR
jgi:hypothetical protein